MNHRRLMAASVLLACAGCIPLSLQPIYTPDVLRWDPRLLGSWGGGNGDGTVWTFSADNEQEKRYRLTAADEDEKASYLAHLVQLDDTYFVDLFVEEYPGFPKDGDFLGMQLVPVHSFLKITLEQDALTIHMLSADWLQDRISKKRLTVPYQPIEALDGWPVFTATPKRMQRFLRKWAHVEGAWESGDTLPRIKAAGTGDAVAFGA